MISVCMASYNGEKYIKEQILSVLDNLNKEDELVISDDKSTDSTRDIVNEIAGKDDRVRLVDGPRKGVIANFENAIINAKGDYIYLCDQDDLWEPDKVSSVQKCFSDNNSTLVIHDADIVNQDGELINPSFFKFHGTKKGAVNNIIRNSYIGCCMAFKSDMLKYILPIPKNIEMHDQWIGVINDVKGKTVYLDKVLFHYRRHGNNVSEFTHHKVWKMIRNRVVFVVRLLVRIFQNIGK